MWLSVTVFVVNVAAGLGHWPPISLWLGSRPWPSGTGGRTSPEAVCVGEAGSPASADFVATCATAWAEWAPDLRRPVAKQWGHVIMRDTTERALGGAGGPPQSSPEDSWPRSGCPGQWASLWQTWSAAPCFRSSSNWGSSSWGFRAPGYMPHGKDGPTLTATTAPKGAVHWPGRGGAGLGGVRVAAASVIPWGRGGHRAALARLPSPTL